ncbi:S1 family peptidase [Flagellimonas sp.]|uniref:S1 family peptidase n=1 Tax=Flagellimonas sp. TaxID=2058762 RepID=UPI003BAB6E60
MKNILVIVIAVFSITASAQSLSKKRITQLDKSVVRIFVNDTASGTGFFAAENWIITNRHVIERGIIRDSISKEVINILPIKAQLANKDVFNLEILESQLIGGENDLSVALDFVLLKVDSLQSINLDLKSKIRPLKMGSWDDVSEGDVVYTCGYPLSIKDRFISTGTLSTKFTSKEKLRTYRVLNDKGKQLVLRNTGKPLVFTTFKERDAAWCDLTVNRGNSGGPVIKLNKFPKKDVVIGITSFLQNPYYRVGEEGAKYYNEIYEKNKEKGMTVNKQMATLFEALATNSFGIGGIISIDYANSILSQLNQ